VLLVIQQHDQDQRGGHARFDQRCLRAAEAVSGRGCPQVHSGRLPAPKQAQDRSAQHGAGQLRGGVPGEVVRVDLALGEEREGDDGVEVRAAAPAQRADRQQAAGAGEQQPGDQQPR